MKKMLNGMFFILKIVLLLLSMGITLYIVLSMYKRINKNIIDSVNIFLPFLLILIIYMINIFLKQDGVNKNLFYNLTSCLVFMITILIGYRAIFDKNLLLNGIMGYNIDFIYFSDYLSFMKIMLYGLLLGNLFFMVTEKEKEKKETEKSIATKVDIEVL